MHAGFIYYLVSDAVSKADGAGEHMAARSLPRNEARLISLLRKRRNTSTETGRWGMGGGRKQSHKRDAPSVLITEKSNRFFS